jgi:cation transport regulator
MPYKINKDLPSAVKNVLPSAAQTIFRKAFNNAHEHYRSEVRAFKVAWAAVKRQYEKREGKWTKI